MATSIASLPNEIPEKNNIKVQVNEMNTNQQPQKELQTQLSPESINQIVQGIQKAASTNMTGLPSKDIPMDQTDITQDEQTKPNYIPKPNNNNYIEQQDSLEQMIMKNMKKEEEKNQMDFLYDELQTPIITMVLFIFFQMPYFKNGFVELFPQLFRRDGNPTMGGILFKSFLFATVYYMINKTTVYLSES
jgi:hypothetical protein